MHFDPTVTLGNLLSLAAMVAATLGVYVRIAERLARIETKIDVLWERRQPRRE